MQVVNRKTVVFIIIVVALVFVSGCSNWKKKYTALEVDHQNLTGLFENCQLRLDSSASDQAQMAEQLLAGQQTIEELEKKLQEGSIGDASGFGDQYDVSYDRAAGTLTVTLDNKILFAPGKATLRSKSSADLNHIMSVVQDRYGSRRIDVAGHTDSDPIKKSKWADNWELSAQRALSVVRYLEKQGISESRLRAVGCGQAYAIASNASSSGKAQNRRVEIIVHMR